MAGCKTVTNEIVIAKTEADPVSWMDFPEVDRKAFCREFLSMGYELFQREDIREEFRQWQQKKNERPVRADSDRSSASERSTLLFYNSQNTDDERSRTFCRVTYHHPTGNGEAVEP